MLGTRLRPLPVHEQARGSGNPRSPPRCPGQGIPYIQKEVILTNYVDVILGILLIVAFLRGFSGGLWKSLFSLASTAAAFAGAYLLAGPLTNLIERNYGVLKSMSSWWDSIFGSVPGLAVPYDPGTFDQVFTAAGGSWWSGAFQGALRQNVLAVQSFAGPNPTWSTMLGLALARLVLSAAMFLVLLAVLRLACNLFAGSLAFGAPSTFSVRFMGAILEVAISAVWLSILSGVLYPVLSAGLLGNTDEVVAKSVVMPVLLSIYRVLWPALMAKFSS